jgi:pimeloyl-ACP methyl ester carboxylesterase
MKQTVILLHGLGRSARSMGKLAATLEAAGYTVHNLNYPSRQHGIEWLCTHYLAPLMTSQPIDQPIHVVTHSLGGILIRQYLLQHTLPAGSRIVMLAPPNHGSEVADHLRHWKLFQWLLGPCLQQLGTDSDVVTTQLPAMNPASIEIGIITGNRSVYPPRSWWIAVTNDGIVSVQSAQLPGMTDFIVNPAGHGFIMRKALAIQQTFDFLRNGCFTQE